MNEDISFSAGPQPLWGSREWTVEIRMQSNRSSIVIFTHRDRAPEEKYANSIEDLVHLLIAFAEENDIPVFERKVVSFLSDYITQAGLDIGFFDILDALRKQREAESRLLIEEDAHFQSGGLHSADPRGF